MTWTLFRATLTVIVCLSTLTLFACEKAPAPESLNEPLLSEFRRDTMGIERSAGGPIEFSVYLARTDEEMKQGLMFVRHLADQTGMLFLYPQARTGSMWMKNTVLSLDILFIRSDGTISDIELEATPQSLKSIRSSVSVKGALELRAGSVEKFGIAVGDRVLHPYFDTR